MGYGRVLPIFELDELGRNNMAFKDIGMLYGISRFLPEESINSFCQATCWNRPMMTELLNLIWFNGSGLITRKLLQGLVMGIQPGNRALDADFKIFKAGEECILCKFDIEYLHADSHIGQGVAWRNEDPHPDSSEDPNLPKIITQHFVILAMNSDKKWALEFKPKKPSAIVAGVGNSVHQYDLKGIDSLVLSDDLQREIINVQNKFLYLKLVVETNCASYHLQNPSLPFELGAYVFTKKHNVVKFGERQLHLRIDETTQACELTTTLDDDDVAQERIYLRLDTVTCAIYDLLAHSFVVPARFKEHMLRLFHGCVRAINLTEVQDLFNTKRTIDNTLKQNVIGLPGDASRLSRSAKTPMAQGRCDFEESAYGLTTEERLLYLTVGGISDTEQVRSDAVRLGHYIARFNAGVFIAKSSPNNPMIKPPDSYFVSLWSLAKYLQTHYPFCPSAILTLSTEHPSDVLSDTNRSVDEDYAGGEPLDGDATFGGLTSSATGPLVKNGGPFLKRHTLAPTICSPIVYTPPSRQLIITCTSPTQLADLTRVEPIEGHPTDLDQIVATPQPCNPFPFVSEKSQLVVTPPTRLSSASHNSDSRSDISMSSEKGSGER